MRSPASSRCWRTSATKGAGSSRSCCRIAAPRAAAVGTPTSFKSADRWSGRAGCPARRPGKSQWDAELVTVFMLSRFAMCSSSRAATGSGTGEAGSPSRSRVFSGGRSQRTLAPVPLHFRADLRPGLLVPAHHGFGVLFHGPLVRPLERQPSPLQVLAHSRLGQPQRGTASRSAHPPAAASTTASSPRHRADGQGLPATRPPARPRPAPGAP